MGRVPGANAASSGDRRSDVIKAGFCDAAPKTLSSACHPLRITSRLVCVAKEIAVGKHVHDPDYPACSQRIFPMRQGPSSHGAIVHVVHSVRSSQRLRKMDGSCHLLFPCVAMQIDNHRQSHPENSLCVNSMLPCAWHHGPTRVVTQLLHRLFLYFGMILLTTQLLTCVLML